MEKTNLNVKPYYDDFNEDKNFHRVLFRPGFAVQARELTQLQSILQNQIERHGRHIFKEGTVVIPGAVGFTNDFYAVKLESSFANNVEITEYLSEYVGTRITGTTSGVVAEVILAETATTTDPITLFVKYVKTGTDNVTTRFIDGENISSDSSVGGFGIGIDSATLISTGATATGSAANIEEGVYFVRGHFVQVATQRLILDKYTNTPSYRVGLLITESIETPEEDASLLDNAQGTSNLNAKGAHRLKISVALAKLSLDNEKDENFVELIRLVNGEIKKKVRNTEYAVFEEAMAKRTFEQMGNFTVKPFDVQIRECLDDGFNNGVYQEGDITESGNVASDDYLTYQISPGKAYVNGYPIETIAPKFIDILKPRDLETYDQAITPVEIGNYVIVNNIYNSPEISPYISGDLPVPYRQIDFYNERTGTRGSSSGTRIGFARARAFEHFENNSGSTVDSIVSSTNTNTSFKLYLFDIRMFTKITISAPIDPTLIIDADPAVPNNIVGSKVTGSTSNAYGYISSETSGTTLVLTSVVGSFIAGETLKATYSEDLIDDGASDVTVSSIETFDFSSVKQVFMSNPTATKNFSADVVLNASYSLTGLITYTSGTTIEGFQTLFLSELQVGDIISVPSGTNQALEERRVTIVNSDTQITISSALTTAITSVQANRKRAGLVDQNKNILLRKLQKKSIKTLKTTKNSGASQTFLTVRRSFVGTTTPSGQVSFPLGSNETFAAKDNTDYVLSVLQAGTAGSAATGDIVNIDSANVTVIGEGTNTLTVTSSSVLGNGAIIRLITTVNRTLVSEKLKTRNRVSLVLAENTSASGGSNYGTSAHHKDISLGVADGLKLHAVYDSEDPTLDPLLPQWTLSSASGVFHEGEIITGQTSGAKGRVVSSSSPVKYIPLNSLNFIQGEQIKGFESKETATLDVYTEGSKNITNRFVFDSGQRDNYYDIARIIRKPNAVAPSGKLLIVFDYFTHNTGDFFTVDSYSSIDYKDIPTYTATRVDPEVREPTGEYDLRDTVDFRPRISDVTSTSVITADQSLSAETITGFSFNFENRNFYDNGSSVTNIPKDNSNFGYDFEYYLSRIDAFTITPEGEFKVLLGTPAEVPAPPKQAEGAMKLSENSLAPFMVDIKDSQTTTEVKKKYTAEDIGKLEQRLSNIEYYTALNLLEKEAKSFEVLDENGLNRFKSGFLVDGFTGHSIGNVNHPDYNVSIDMQNKELRPKYYMKGISLIEDVSTVAATAETERSNNYYQKTGDILTLPYTHTITAQQQYATRVENLNPVLNFSWAGICRLSPSGDEWFEVDRLPDLIINREGNFDTVLAENRNALGTVWNAWQNQWSGVTTSSSTTWRDTSFSSAFSRSVPGRAIVQTTVTSERGTSSRTGVQTSVIPQIDQESQGDRVLSRAVIPFIRAKNVEFTVVGMKPLTRVYPFFDRTNVSNLVTPTGGSEGDALVTTASGKLTGTFRIPNPNVTGNPRFRTGDRLFRLTSDITNSEEVVETFAQATYSATGILNTVQETIISTRNARVEVTEVSETQNITRQVGGPVNRVVGWWDPLAQSFMPQANGGEYLTKIDVYFAQKDNDLPVTCQIREMQNGYPTTKVLPFGSKTLEPSEVSTSDDATIATTFTFDEPVYVKNGVEYCIVLFTDSAKYLAWISRMGELDIGGSRLVSEQPYLGVLFKSQNNTTWTAYDFEDLKFTLYRASFDTSATGTVTFVNDTLPVKELEEDPIRTFVGSNVIKIHHRDHHMYSTSNNVTISGVEANDNTGTLFNGIPITEINKTHTNINNIQIDSYTITTTSPATSSGLGGGSSVSATENALADSIQTLIPVIEHPETSLVLKMIGTSGTSASGSQTSFVKDPSTQAKNITINDNYYFANPKMICSEINETNELGSVKSLELKFTLKTNVENLSPIIDLDRKSLITVANRLDNITQSSNVYPTDEFVSAIEPDGDSLEAIYITRKVQLKTPATAIKLLFVAVQFSSSNIEAMYKTLRSDDASDFDEIGWQYFNGDGTPDTTVNSSTTNDDFIEREYSADDLEEFIAFAIKIRMKGTNTCEPPRIKDLRAIALAT